jgi:hypothetical protein
MPPQGRDERNPRTGTMGDILGAPMQPSVTTEESFVVGDLGPNFGKKGQDASRHNPVTGEMDSPFNKGLGYFGDMAIKGGDLRASETTKLKPEDESEFREWINKNQIRDLDDPRSYYDYRGLFLMDRDSISSPELHFPDLFKQHGHPTFSEESVYSKRPGDGGIWDGETFIPSQQPRQIQPSGMTEFSRSGYLPDGGDELVEYPLIVPGLDESQLRYLLEEGWKEKAKIPQDIEIAARNHAQKRINAGKSPFATPDEADWNRFPNIERRPRPVAIPDTRTFTQTFPE